MTPIEAALHYASWGWAVIPVVPNGKVPATAHGVRDATTDPDQIAAWWTQNPLYNIGIAAGAISGIVVLDIDPRNGGEESWQAWIAENGTVPDGPLQLTAGGGEHYIARYDSDIRSCKLREGIDLLSDGRYFVAFPSTIEGRSYQWEASGDPFDGVAPFPLPDQWKAAYSQQRKPVATASSGNIIQGNRNNALTALGGAMRHYGMTEAEIFAALAIANETRCEIPLPSSELSQIVKSVCRYEPETDIASNAGIGDDAAEALLAAAQAETQDYFLTRATSFLDQPAPLKWVIKGWMPADAVSMIYGESGAGKTFVSLDIACHIAAGMPWHGVKASGGPVVYMAGEGNYGLRQRVAAWCRMHGVDRLDRLLISNKAIDMDSPAAAAQILNAVRAVTDESITMLFVDTLNNHMAGDENSARDTRNLFNSVAIVSRALNSAACIVHHTGHSETAQTRARGSSALKASLDASILVRKNDEGAIEITCTKMKDAESPSTIYGALKSIPLGWMDEDGEEISGAAFEINSDYQPKKKEKKGIQEEIKQLEQAWFFGNAMELNGAPYLSRSALVDWMVEKRGLTLESAQVYVRPSQKGRMVSNLLTGGIIEPAEDGWIVVDGTVRSNLKLLKN
jgi:hypothetical protein